MCKGKNICTLIIKNFSDNSFPPRKKYFLKGWMIVKMTNGKLEELVEKNKFDLSVTTAKDGVEELRIIVSEEKLSLEFLKKTFFERISRFRMTAGHSSLELAKEISSLTGIKLLNPGLFHYSNQMGCVDLQRSVRGKRVFVIGSICRSICDDPTQEKIYYSGDDNYAQLRRIIQAITFCWGRRIILSVPYFDFAKQDVQKGRQPLPFADFAKEIESYRLLRGLISMFPHCEQTKNAFRDIPVDYIPIQPFAFKIIQIIAKISDIPEDKICIGAFDAGSVKRLASLSEISGIDLFINYKKKASEQDIQSMGTEGDPAGFAVFPIDDFVHSAGTLRKGRDKAAAEGATGFFVFCGHIDTVYNTKFGIHADDLILDDLCNGKINRFIFSDSTPLARALRKKAVARGLQGKIMILKAAEILAHDFMRCALEIPASEFLRIT